jgi:hypothetical protein
MRSILVTASSLNITDSRTKCETKSKYWYLLGATRILRDLMASTIDDGVNACTK